MGSESAVKAAATEAAAPSQAAQFDTMTEEMRMVSSDNGSGLDK